MFNKVRRRSSLLIVLRDYFVSSQSVILGVQGLLFYLSRYQLMVFYHSNKSLIHILLHGCQEGQILHL